MAAGEKRTFLALISANDCSGGRELSAHANLSFSTEHSSGILGVNASDTTSSLLAINLSNSVAKVDSPNIISHTKQQTIHITAVTNLLSCGKLFARCTGASFWRTYGVGIGAGAGHWCTVVCNPADNAGLRLSSPCPVEAIFPEGNLVPKSQL
jgi:hypothetical protein